MTTGTATVHLKDIFVGGTGECGARRELADGDWATGSRRPEDTQNG